MTRRPRVVVDTNALVTGDQYLLASDLFRGNSILMPAAWTEIRPAIDRP